MCFICSQLPPPRRHHLHQQLRGRRVRVQVQPGPDRLQGLRPQGQVLVPGPRPRRPPHRRDRCRAPAPGRRDQVRRLRLRSSFCCRSSCRVPQRPRRRQEDRVRRPRGRQQQADVVQLRGAAYLQVTAFCRVQPTNN